MNYYERHLGDYIRDTAHLSLLEHGVYNVLLDRCYVTECGIPDDQKYRISRARTDEERQAVDVILDEFFVLMETQEKPTGLIVGSENEETGFQVKRVWINRRVLEEIEKAKIRINAAKANGKKGGRPAKQPKENQDETQQKPTGFNSDNPTETQHKAYQTPDTRHQSPVGINKTHTEDLEGVGDLTPGQVCVFLTEQGILQTNPSHADLIEALRGGAVLSDFAYAATEAITKNKGFAYLLKIAIGNMEKRKNANKQQKPKSVQVDPVFAEKYAHLMPTSP